MRAVTAKCALAGVAVLFIVGCSDKGLTNDTPLPSGSGQVAADTSGPSTPPADTAGHRVDAFLESNQEFVAENGSGAPGTRVICATKTIGREPDSAVTDDQASTVFAWIFCSWLPSPDVRPWAGLDVDDLSTVTGPIAVHFLSTPTYEMPEDGEGHPDSIKRIFPAEVRRTATDGIPDAGTLKREVETRLRAMTSPN